MGLDNAKIILLAAYRGVPMPKDCDLSDLKLYNAMRLLYQQFGMLMVTQAEAMRERDQLLEAWRKEKRNEQESISV